MTQDIATTVILGTGIAAALVAGIFYAFSTFVMGALARIAPEKGIAAMQSINAVVLNPWAMGAFFGTALAVLGLIVFGSVFQPGADRLYLILGGVAYLGGTIGVTALANVPMNKALDRLPAEARSSDSYWFHYCRRWTFWNHVRTTASLLSAGFLIASAV